MRLTGEDVGRLRTKPRLISYLTEAPPKSNPPCPCGRLLYYLLIAKETLNHFQVVDGIRPPSNFPSGQGLVNETSREYVVARHIIERDPDLLGMLITPPDMSSDLDRISHVYARMVLGSETDPNCETIVASLRRLGFSVPAPGTCSRC